MALNGTSLDSRTGLEDVLAHLPISGTMEYGKGQRIYGPENHSKDLYLVLTGTVEVSQIAEDGSAVLLDILRPDDLFGESAFVDVSCRAERATAIEKAKLMAWAITDMEDLVIERPRLGLALLQILSQRNAEFTRRIESFSIDTVERPLARSLIQLSERLGTPEEGGDVRMMPFTHALLSRYVGTSREVVTVYMNRFRKQGYIDYSHQGILLRRDTLKTSLRNSFSRVEAVS